MDAVSEHPQELYQLPAQPLLRAGNGNPMGRTLQEDEYTTRATIWGEAAEGEEKGAKDLCTRQEVVICRGNCLI